MVTFNNNLHSYIFKQRKRVRGMFFLLHLGKKYFIILMYTLIAGRFLISRKFHLGDGGGEAIFLSPNKIFNTGTIIFGIGGRIRPSRVGPDIRPVTGY